MAKQFFLLLIIIAVISISVSSCTNASKEELIPAGPCDTVSMSYHIDIIPILSGNCYECHGATTHSTSGVNLSDYNTLKSYANGVEGQLYQNITHTSTHPMPPPPLPKLSDCDINKILDWINQGAPNN
jgi:cytochrome c553